MAFGHLQRVSVPSRTVRVVAEIVRYTYRLRPGARAERALMRARALGHAYTVKGREKPVVKHRKRALPSLEYTRRGFRIYDRRLCLPAADAAIGAAKRELVERGRRAGRTVVLVPPACTTMTCSECGEKQARLGLAERTFQCRDCGYTAGRDRNAARVILATAERGRAGADDVRHSLASFPGASGVRSEPEIPPASAAGNRYGFHTPQTTQSATM